MVGCRALLWWILFTAKREAESFLFFKGCPLIMLEVYNLKKGASLKEYGFNISGQRHAKVKYWSVGNGVGVEGIMCTK